MTTIFLAITILGRALAVFCVVVALIQARRGKDWWRWVLITAVFSAVAEVSTTF